MTLASPASALTRARDGLRRSNLRKELDAVATGRKDDLTFDIDDRALGAAAILTKFAQRYRVESIERQRLIAALRNAGIADVVVGRLAAKGSGDRRQSAQVLGALRMSEALAWLAPLLGSPNRAVSDAAARALGRIGGARASEILLHAIMRSGLRRTLVAELARAAPDLFLEVALSEQQKSGVKAGAALAAGLRRRQTAVGPLLALLMSGGQRERAIACRALGWIGSPVALPALTSALDDPEWKVRLAAAKALRRFTPGVAAAELERRLMDQNARVRLAAGFALRHAMSPASVAG